MGDILLPKEFAALEASPHRPMHILQVSSTRHHDGRAYLGLQALNGVGQMAALLVCSRPNNLTRWGTFVCYKAFFTSHLKHLID